MAILIPRKSEYWYQSPPDRPEIDWSNELATTLSTALIFGDNSTDLIKGREITIAGDAYIGDDGAYFDESGDYLTVPNVVINSAYTVTTQPTFVDNAGNLFEYFFSFGAVATANSLNIYSHEGSAAQNPDGLRATTNGDPRLDIVDYYPSENGKVISFAQSGTSGRWFLDGSSVVEGSSGTAAMADGTTRTLYLGGRSDLNADRFFGGVLPFVYIHDEKLDVDQAAQLAQNPYQILKQRKTYFLFPESGAAGAYTLVCDSGAYTVTGTDAGLIKDSTLTADSGSYTYSGTALDFIATGSFVMGSGAYTYTGTDTTLEYNAIMAADSGAYTYTGTATDLTYGNSFQLDSGSYAVTGTDIAFNVTSVVTLDSGTYSYTGNSLTLNYSGIGTWTVQPDSTTSWIAQSDSNATWTIQ